MLYYFDEYNLYNQNLWSDKHYNTEQTAQHNIYNIIDTNKTLWTECDNKLTNEQKYKLLIIDIRKYHCYLHVKSTRLLNFYKLIVIGPWSLVLMLGCTQLFYQYYIKPQINISVPLYQRLINHERLLMNYPLI